MACPHAWASRRAGGGRVVTCHLGAGASLAAVRDGRCVDTTMGFTPLEGLVMATRSGSVDPGLLMWLLQEAGMAPGELAQALEHKSGWSGWPARPTCARWSPTAAWRSTSTCTACGRTSRPWRPPPAGSTPSCSPAASASAARRCAPARPTAWRFLGVEVDAARNARGEEDIGAGPVRVMVVEAREDLEIAHGVRTVSSY